MSSSLSLAELESYDAGAKRSGVNRRFCCEDCGGNKPRDDAHRSMCVNTDSGAYLCHRCGKKGLLTEKWTKPTFTPRKVRTAAAFARVFRAEPLPTPASTTECPSEPMLRETLRLAKPLSNTKGQSYLESRGIPLEPAMASGVFFSPKFYGRPAVVFPMLSRDGETVAVNGRFVDGRERDGTSRKTQIAGKKSLGLFITPGALEADTVALCESCFDALSLYLCGVPAVAMVGTSGAAWLANALAFRNVFVALNADAAGDKGSDMLIETLKTRGARAVRLRPNKCNDWSELLQTHGSDALRETVEQAIAESFNFHQNMDAPIGAPSQPENFILQDVFTVENDSGQLALDYVFAGAEKHGDELLLSMPTLEAYESECALAAAFDKHSKGELPNAALERLTMRFIAAHLRVNGVSDAWTGKEVPSFYLTVKIKGERVEGVTCNRIQSWIIREFWLRRSPEAEISVMNL
jgi:hypothetical protein